MLEHRSAISSLGSEELEEHADRGQTAGNGLGGLAALRLRAEIAAKFVGVGGEDGAVRFGEEVAEIFQVAAIGEKGVLSQPAFRSEKDQKRTKVRQIAARVEGGA